MGKAIRDRQRGSVSLRYRRLPAADGRRCQVIWLPPYPLALATAAEAEAFAIHLKNVGLVGQPIEQGTDQALRAEHRYPLIEGQITGDWVPPRS